MRGGVTQPERKRVAEEITEDFRREYPEPTTQSESTLALKKTLKDRLNARILAVRKRK
ncbi:hypothetical protein PISMIDRAFT_528405 [Pisolithus microcarpus 441]|uniref:Uncharacterized protein n=1 Tax=Pisolithus microcarpus 441 TaxID=765257 RepID=A0A0C9ZQL5_9AGAM|nr:hypothetical protein PISMIDRAFT_528405 [Pisolithus microcarpus 441]